jgi:hypothetical protein
MSQGLPSTPSVTSIAISRQTPSTVYVATWDRVYRSTDSGAQWVDVSTGSSFSGVEALAMKPGAPMTILAGTLGRGVYKTTTAGQ